MDIGCPKCTQVLHIEDRHQGAAVRCPRCMTQFPAQPAPAPAPPAPPASNMVFPCHLCKTPLQVPTHAAGQIITCPRCRTNTTVPASVPVARLLPDTPATTPAPAPSAPTLPDRPGATSPLTSTANSPPRPAITWRVPLLIAAVLFVFLVGAVIAFNLPAGKPTTVADDTRPKDRGTTSPDGKQPEPPPVVRELSELDFVPGNALALYALRPGDLWKSPQIQQLWAMVPDNVRAQQQGLNDQYGFDMADYERATVVIGNQLGTELWVVLKLATPFDQAKKDKLLGTSAVEWQSRTHKQRRYYLGELPVRAQGPEAGPMPIVVFPINETLVLASPTEEGMKRALNLIDEPRPDGPLAPLRERLRVSTAHFFLGSEIAANAQQDVREIQAQVAQGFQPIIRAMLGGDVPEARAAQLQVTFGQRTDISARITYDAATDASRMQRSLGPLQQWVQALTPFIDQQTVGQLPELLKSIRVTAEERDLVVRADLDLVALVPDLRKRLQEAIVNQEVTPRNEAITGANNLRQIAAAVQAYRRARGHYPPASVCDAAGNPLYSWRVELLPFLGRQALYQRFDRTKAWNHPDNAALLDEMPEAFRLPSQPRASQKSQTCLVLLTGPITAFAGRETAEPTEPGKTLLLVPSRQLVPWTAPTDLVVPDAEAVPAFLQGVGVLLGDTFPAASFDGTVKEYSRRMPASAFLDAVRAR